MNNEINIANKFCYDGYIVSIKPIGAGHINKTYLVETTKKSILCSL
jgi:hypothetical protein